MSSNKLKGNKIIGIVKEVYNKWERRAPLCPVHVERLVKQGCRVLVQPSDRRIFTNIEYEKVGAEITEDLSPASVIFGVKQVPVEDLLPERSYVFFSSATSLDTRIASTNPSDGASGAPHARINESFPTASRIICIPIRYASTLLILFS